MTGSIPPIKIIVVCLPLWGSGRRDMGKNPVNGSWVKEITVNLRVLFCSALMSTLALFAGGSPLLAASDPGIPHLQKQGTATRLIVNGKPFLALAGELSNNAATSLENMKLVWPKLVAQAKLNTVLAGVSWAQIEPEEGKFDFHVLDGVIQEARTHDMHLVLLWFASWKNGLSSYPPYWVKKDFKRFPRAQIARMTLIGGKKILEVGKSIELLTPLSDANRDADARAFAALMRHVKEVDGRQHTVIMIQVENEVGMLQDSRDRSPAADVAFAKPVPQDLMNYLVQHKETLAPELREVWAANGSKTAGTWAEVFGPGKPAPAPPLTPEEAQMMWRKVSWASDEIFMAWNYSRYVDKVVAAGKAEYDIPMFCNAWLQQPDMPRPGEYPSGGPVPQVHDIWRCGAPHVNFLAPDMYLRQTAEVCGRFTRNGNAIFIPETRYRHAGQGALRLRTP